MRISLNGEWNVTAGDITGTMILPGTLDENAIGVKDLGKNQWHPDSVLGNGDGGFDENAPIATRFTRKVTFEGQARISKIIQHKTPEGMRLFLHVERARALTLWIEGEQIEPVWPATISTPYEFEITGLLDTPKEVVFYSDNSYPGWPHDAIVYSSAATDETQTNWNGLLGEFYLEERPETYLEEVLVYQITENHKPVAMKVRLIVNASSKGECALQVTSEAFCHAIQKSVQIIPGQNTIELETISLKEDLELWDEGQGNLYSLEAILGESTRKILFGIRDFSDNGAGRLALNGRTIFLRSEANCCEFPETGHAPMTVDEWRKILKRYQAYGVNCMRFHSHVPPKAAFVAADEMGMLMQPELSHWNPKDAFESEESFAYYKEELMQVIRDLNVHPSFVMMTFGNELHAGELGHKRMDELLAIAKSSDATRLYANASNPHYGALGADPRSDFYTSQNSDPYMMRGTSAGMKGHINETYPSARVDYDACLTEIRKTYAKPVFSFEVGQFEVLPDFDELDLFHGISDPVNYRLIKEKAQKCGLLPMWKQIVEATGELALIGYREEVEAAMRTKELSGISLLSLQDFPGQGTALVGMMNSHLEPKPFSFAKPERFATFFRDTMILCKLPRYTYESGEELRAEVEVANYGRRDLSGDLSYQLVDKGSEQTLARGKIQGLYCPCGAHTMVGTITVPCLSTIPVRANLTLTLDGVQTSYPVWIYPKVEPVCPENVYETKVFDKEAEERLKNGGIVYLTPQATKEAMPHSIGTQFTTDFWSVGTFPFQEGGMGQLIEAKHPIFTGFPTDFHTDYEWWPMASTRALILPNFEKVHSIVTQLDSYATMRPMSMLFECQVEKGKLLFSSMGLAELKKYPEVKALQASIYTYLASKAFAPKAKCDVKFIKELFTI